jgi:hypothetical protein
MQASPKKQEPVAVVLDCEVGRNVDNVLTLALLQGLSKRAKPEGQFAAVSLTRSDLQAAAYCDAVGRFYNTIWLRKYPKRFQRYRGFSVGLDAVGAPGPSAALAAALDRKTPEGEALYPHEVHDISDTADPVALIRNALTAKADGGFAVVLAGSARNLAALLAVNGAEELIRAKVRVLVVAMDEERIQADVDAARKLFSEWPTPIVAVASTPVRFPVDTEFAWTENHPVADALRSSGSDAGTASLAAALYAVLPQAEGFELSAPGQLVIDGGGLRLERVASGRHRMLSANHAALVDVYREIITAEPAAREPSGFVKRILEEEAAKKKLKEETGATP